MIINAKNMGLDRLFLTDNSYLLSEQVKLQLIYLRTMLRGRPFYAKYKFIPVSNEEQYIFYHNDKNFLSNPTISKKRLLKYIAMLNVVNSDTPLDTNTKDYNINIDKYLTTNFIPSLLEINSVKDIINKLILDSKKIKDICKFLNNIYINIYEYAGYKPYLYKSFQLNLADANIK
jgi:hypothetical protein